MKSPRRRSLRLRRSNRFKCLLCYLLAFGAPLLWQAAALGWIYPRKLAATAPDVLQRLAELAPALGSRLAPLIREASPPAPAAAQALRAALAARESQWLAFAALWAGAAWALTLLCQLIWRAVHSRPLLLSRATRRAVRSYRLLLLAVAALNAAFAWGLWQLAVCRIPGRTVWDWLVYFGVYALHPAAAALVSRLAASAAISGRRAFFKRL